MAQYDGSIRINTQIDSKNASAQLMALENRIVKTADKVASLRSKMDALKNTKIPTQEYSEISAQIQKAESEFNKLLEKQEQMQREGKDNGIAWERLNAKMEEVGNTIRYAQGELQDLVSTGKAFTIESDTQEYANLGQQLQYAENDLSALNQRHDELIAKQNKSVDGYRTLAQIAKSALSSVGNTVKKAAASSFRFLGKEIKKAASAMLNFGKSTKSANGILNGGLKNILKYGLGIRSLFVLINKLRSAIKDGFSNLYNSSETFRNQIDEIKASALTLKNTFAAAFRPLVETAIPYIKKVLDYMTQAVNAAGQLMAALLGRKAYTKAIKQTTAAIKEQNKVQNKQLSNLDELNNLTAQKDSGAAGGGAGMFEEEVPISDKWKNIADWLKDMWEKSDFYDLGKLLGEKLKNALDSIPWNKIKATARKIGKILATLINGFIEVKGLGYSIGKTLIEAINTGFEFLNQFVHKLHWESVGKFIADTLNGFFENIDWPLIRDTFITGFKGLAKSINQFIADFHWENVSNTISNAINTITESVFTFFSAVKWGELGQKLGEQLMESIEKIDWEQLGRAIGSIVQAALDFTINFVKKLDFGEVAKAILDVLKGFFETVDMGDLANVLLTALSVKMAISATSSLFDAAASAILNALGVSIGSSGALATLGSTIAAPIIAGIVAAFAGWNFGQYLYEKITGEQIEISFAEQVKEIFSSFTDGSWVEAFKMWGSDIVEGLKEGIIDNFSTEKITSFILTFMFSPFLSIFKSLFGIHSPSTVMAEMGSYIVQGLLNGLKEKWNDVVEWLTSKISWLSEKLSGIASSVTSAFSGGGFKSTTFSVKSAASPYAASPAFSAMQTAEIPRLATGTVIPPNKEFLAVLGDQKHGTNIEAPLETIKQAQKDALMEIFNNLGLLSGGGNGQEINLNLTVECEGYKLLELIRKLDREFYAQHQEHAFT